MFLLFLDYYMIIQTPHFNFALVSCIKIITNGIACVISQKPKPGWQEVDCGAERIVKVLILLMNMRKIYILICFDKPSTLKVYVIAL